MRSSGILMHITSLPSPHGVGTLGKAAYEFVDFLEKAKQHYWQILPVGPTGYGDSPYQTFCTFAGNPYMIDLDLLVEEHLLEPAEITEISWCETPCRVDYGTLFEQRSKVLRQAFARFDQAEESYVAFQRENASWLDEYALFMVLKHHFGGKFWGEWPEDIRNHQANAVAYYQELLQEEIAFQKFQQYLFFRQWRALRAYAHSKGVQVIGDVPIYVPLDSSDVWTHPENFQLDAERRPRSVAGVPPDYFSADGQLWGNPLYDWEKMQADGFDWWIRRMRAAAEIFDVVRIDHFRGFESYWAVPYGETTARNGQWIKGPGMHLIHALKAALPELHFIAEDLGFLTPEVIALVADSGFPGMKVLEFAFDPREPSDYLPHTYTKNCICYTGTHDNETLSQWVETAGQENVEYAARYLAKREQESLCNAVIRGGMASVADLFVAQMQDWLELGAEARMNQPGLVGGINWRWRALPGQLTNELAARIADMTSLYGRT